MKDTLVFLLAGGEGTRLSPLTRDRSKPAVPFGGKWRLIDFTLSNCLHSRLSKIFVLTQYKSESLTRHIYEAWHMFRPVLGESINILPPQMRGLRDFYRGTADAVYQNLYTIRREAPRDVVILSGDHVYAMDYRPYLAFHHEMDAGLTIATFPVPRSEAHRFGILRAGGNGRVVSFLEKPKDTAVIPPSDSPQGGGNTLNASMGVYIFKTSVLARELEEGPGFGRRFDFGRDIIPAMIGRERVFIFPFTRGPSKHGAYWRDVGTLDSYFDSHMELMGGRGVSLDDTRWPIIHETEHTGPAVFGAGRGVGVHNCIVGGGCRIDGRMSNTVCFPGVTVEAGAQVSDAVLLQGVHVEANAVIQGAILDKEVLVQGGARIGMGAGSRNLTRGSKINYTTRGIAVVPKGEVVATTGEAVPQQDRTERLHRMLPNRDRGKREEVRKVGSPAESTVRREEQAEVRDKEKSAEISGWS